MIVDLQKIKDLWKNNHAEDHLFQLYVHSPFCRSICRFCAYKGTLLDEEAYNVYYHKYLPRLISEFSEIISSVKVDRVYFGGGTPSLMSLKDMILVFDLIPGFKQIKDKYFEIHPSFFNEEKMSLLKEYNFKTVVFGIQTFSEEVNQKANRSPQYLDQIVELVKSAKRLGLKTSIDLLAYDGNKSLEEDMIIADKLEFDMISFAVDYNIRQKEKEYVQFFLECISRFLKEHTYGMNRSQDLNSLFQENKNLRFYRSGIDYSIDESVFEYDSNYEDYRRGKTNTMGLGSYKNMVPTTSFIGNRIRYVEINDNWEPKFDILECRDHFSWNAVL